MHATLFIGDSKSTIKLIYQKIKEENLAKIDFPLKSIKEVKDFINFTRSGFQAKTAIVVQEFHDASEEAQNAFLKMLEEPPNNTQYFITAISEEKLLQTIVSRCQIIKVANISKMTKSQIGKVNTFVNSSTSQRLEIINKITNREDAKKFTINLLHSLDSKSTSDIKIKKQVDLCIQNLDKGGNVQLQLTNFVLSLE